MSSEEREPLVQLMHWLGTWWQDRCSADIGKMTGRLHPYSYMASSITINRLEIRNRLVMGPMGNVAMADDTGRPTAGMIAYFEERARGGVGLIISGLVPASPESDPGIVRAGHRNFLPRVTDSRNILAGWRDLVTRVHAHDARFFIQLTAGLGRVGSPECVTERWRLPVSASWNSNFYVPQIPCRPLTDHECRRLIHDIGQTAVDAQSCGIDGIHLHGHEGYLFEQFANPAFNRRKFGRYANWQAFGLDAVSEIRRRCGPDYPIMYRLDLSLALAATYGDRMTGVARLRGFRLERTASMSLAYIGSLIAAGVDAIDVDLGCYENWWLPHPPGPMPPGTFLAIAKQVREFLTENGIRTNAGLPIAVAAVGKLGYPDIAERALRERCCDMIMLSRPLLADPEWPQKAFEGRVHAITPCIGDHEACLNEVVRGHHIQCAVNPRAGFEYRPAAEAQKATRPKRVAVVGAGPAGITCACLAAQRGHHVVLFEGQEGPGGWLRAGSAPAIKFDVANYLAHLEYRLAIAAREHGLEIRLSTIVTPDVLGAGGFDAVVTCTGASPIRQLIDTDVPENIVMATDVLLAPSLAKQARSIVVVGGGDVGCETAHMLAYEHDKRVTVIETSAHFMGTSCAANRGYMIHYLEQKGVDLWNCSRVVKVRNGIVDVTRNVSRSVPSAYAVWEPLLPADARNRFARRIRAHEKMAQLPADLIVVAVGLASNSALYRACVERSIAREIHNIGDSHRVGRVFDATKAGYALGSTL